MLYNEYNENNRKMVNPKLSISKIWLISCSARVWVLTLKLIKKWKK